MTTRDISEPTVLGLFEQVDPAADALRKLEAGGHAPRDMIVLSSFPFPEGVLSSDTTKSRLPVITVVSALVGIGLGLALAGGSAALYVLRTGGKPIETGPPYAIICYEAMMLVALTAAFLTALYEMRLPSWRPKVYDRRIAEGLIGIAIHCDTPARAQAVSTLLKDAGAVDVTTDAREFE